MIIKVKTYTGWKYFETQEYLEVNQYTCGNGENSLEDEFSKKMEEHLYSVKLENRVFIDGLSKTFCIILLKTLNGEWYGLSTPQEIYMLNNKGQTIERIN
jgi:hypothetical protein